MNFNYHDESGLLNEEIKELCLRAACKVLDNELGEFFDVSLPLEISISMVDRDEIRKINLQYRNIDKVTDVLSFPQYANTEELKEDIGSSDNGRELLIGDIVICFDKIKEQAEEYGTTEQREFVYLFVHSMLHLMGYDHIEDSDKRMMRKNEEKIMYTLGLTR